MVFQGREEGTIGKREKKKHNRYPFFLSALHVQIAGLPPIRTVLVFLFSAFKTNLICSDGHLYYSLSHALLLKLLPTG
jgi:hypothetical protein